MLTRMLSALASILILIFWSTKSNILHQNEMRPVIKLAAGNCWTFCQWNIRGDGFLGLHANHWCTGETGCLWKLRSMTLRHERWENGRRGVVPGKRLGGCCQGDGYLKQTVETGFFLCWRLQCFTHVYKCVIAVNRYQIWQTRMILGIQFQGWSNSLHAFSLTINIGQFFEVNTHFQLVMHWLCRMINMESYPVCEVYEANHVMFYNAHYFNDNSGDPGRNRSSSNPCLP